MRSVSMSGAGNTESFCKGQVYLKATRPMPMFSLPMWLMPFLTTCSLTAAWSSPHTGWKRLPWAVTSKLSETSDLERAGRYRLDDDRWPLF